MDIPAFAWPTSDFPSLRYPETEHQAENKAEVQRCLDMLRDKLDAAGPGSAQPIAAVIVEPIQGEGGNNTAPVEFFQGIRRLTQERGVVMIADEVQTGMGATGRFWAHQHWNLDSPPDIVTFAKKMQAAGFYHRAELRADRPYRNFNTWLGDPVRAMLLKAIIHEIEDTYLIENTAITGKYVTEQLEEMTSKYPDLLANVRGQGTYIGVDVVPGVQMRDKILAEMRDRGVLVGGCGIATIRLRPMLNFRPAHADIFLATLDSVLADLVA